MKYFSEKLVNGWLCEAEEEPYKQGEHNREDDLKGVMSPFAQCQFRAKPLADLHCGKCHENKHYDREYQCNDDIGHDPIL